MALGPPTNLGGPAFGQPRMFGVFAPVVPTTPVPTVPQFTFLPQGRIYVFTAGGDGVIPYFLKQPSETFPIAFNYAGQLPAGASIIDGTVSAIDASTGLDASAFVLLSTNAAIDDNNVVVRVKSGLAGIDYQLKFLVNLSDNSILEDNMVMRVTSYSL